MPGCAAGAAGTTAVRHQPGKLLEVDFAVTVQVCLCNHRLHLRKDQVSGLDTDLHPFLQKNNFWITKKGKKNHALYHVYD